MSKAQQIRQLDAEDLENARGRYFHLLLLPGELKHDGDKVELKLTAAMIGRDIDQDEQHIKQIRSDLPRTVGMRELFHSFSSLKQKAARLQSDHHRGVKFILLNAIDELARQLHIQADAVERDRKSRIDAADRISRYQVDHPELFKAVLKTDSAEVKTEQIAPPAPEIPLADALAQSVAIDQELENWKTNILPGIVEQVGQLGTLLYLADVGRDVLRVSNERQKKLDVQQQRDADAVREQQRHQQLAGGVPAGFSGPLVVTK